MNPQDPNVAQVEIVVRALGPLAEKVVLVGGCAASLLITDTGHAAIRATRDVDVAVEALTLTDFYRLEESLRARGFKQDMRQGAPACRYLIEEIAVDFIPATLDVAGNVNEWYPEAIASANAIRLPSNLAIRLINAPVFLATKIAAFENRGDRDFEASHDIEDILALIDGREELPDEFAAASADLRKYVAVKLAQYAAQEDFQNAVAGHYYSDEESSERAPIILERLRAIVAKG